MRLKSNVAVAGTHGKTTTTSMVAALLDGGGMDPTVINGGVIHAYGSNARIGAGRVDGGGGRRERRHLQPPARDHRDRHQHRPRASRPLGRLRGAAKAASTPSSRTSRSTASRSAASTTPRCRRWSAASPTAGSRPTASTRRPTCGRATCATRTARRASTWRCNAEGQVIEGVILPMTGDHNVSNALAAIAVARHLGIAQGRDPRGAGGVRRRQPPLHQGRRVERRHHHRRLRPPPGRDRRRAARRRGRPPRAA